MAVLRSPRGSRVRCSLGRIRSDLGNSRETRVEIGVDPDFCSSSLARSGSSISPERLTKLLSSASKIGDAEASGFVVSARWLLKPSRPLATQIQEAKMKVGPSSSTIPELMDAFEFAR